MRSNQDPGAGHCAEDKAAMKLTRGQIIFVVVVVLINVVLWIVPSDVVESVARNRHILLGRYSRRHMTWLLCLIPTSAIAVWLHLAPSAAVKRLRAFRLVTVLIVVVLVLVIGDAYLRLTTRWTYTLGRLTYLRPPNQQFTGEFCDEPLAERSYLRTPPGYGTTQWTLTTDNRGYRNLHSLDRYDVVALGDSFTEGSQVSDGQPWPARLAAGTGLTVCNLGMSGYAPHHCRAALVEFGLDLEPKWVLLLLYEGNDFRRARTELKRPSRWERFFKRSPVISTLDDWMVRALGPIGARRELTELEVLS